MFSPVDFSKNVRRKIFESGFFGLSRRGSVETIQNGLYQCSCGSQPSFSGLKDQGCRWQKLGLCQSRKIDIAGGWEGVEVVAQAQYQCPMIF